MTAPVARHSIANVTNYVAPTTSSYVATIKPASQRVQTYVQPVQQVQQVQYVQQVVQPQYVEAKQSYVQSVPLQEKETHWVEDNIERPQYSKLYNNNAEYHRTLALEEDPIEKKTCCSPCCWILFGLLGLLALVFGILCGLGIFCGGLPSISGPSLTAPTINGPNLTAPTINGPNIDVPTINTPNITLPTIDTPNINLPSINTPNITLPTIDTPNITLPTVDISTPNITTP